jgi:hypothetical protein
LSATLFRANFSQPAIKINRRPALFVSLWSSMRWRDPRSTVVPDQEHDESTLPLKFYGRERPPD